MIDLIELSEYDFWANGEVIDCLSRSDLPENKPLKIMSHVINAYGLWFERIEKSKNNSGVWDIHLPEILKSKNQEYEKTFRKILNEIKSDPEMQTVYVNTSGEKFASYTKDILMHLIIHSSYHRGQVIQLLSRYGLEIPYIDYIHYKRKIKNRISKNE